MRREIGSFAKKVKKGQKTILYEFLPLPKQLPTEDYAQSFSLFAQLYKHYGIDGVNIPEIREEKRNGKRKEDGIAKLAPRDVCRSLQEYGITECIINRPIVYEPWQKQKEWLAETYTSFGIQNIVLVGGESSKITYPGPDVISAAKAITQEEGFGNLSLGGIVIPSRKNEAQRVLKKSQAGITFFTTQILYEGEATKIFLAEYWKLCQKKQIQPGMIFLSFAPVTRLSDIEMLVWLGVAIPEETRTFLTTGWLGMEERSLQSCAIILQDISTFVEKQKIGIPIGLNVEHISRHNFEPSFRLVEQLGRIYL